MKKHRGKVSWNTPKFSREWNSYLEIFSFPGLEVYKFLGIIFFTDINRNQSLGALIDPSIFSVYLKYNKYLLGRSQRHPWQK